MEHLALPFGQAGHRASHQIARLPALRIARRRTFGPPRDRIVAPLAGLPAAEPVVTAVTHRDHHEGSDVAAAVEPITLPPQPLQQVVRHVFRLVGAKQQTLRVAEHTIAQRHDISGEFEFLHCICKTKPTGKTQHRNVKFRIFFGPAAFFRTK